MRKFLVALALLLVGISCLGCGEGAKETGKVEKITAEQAKKIMDSGERYVLLDVRQPEEFAQGHIKGAILLPDNELEQKAAQVVPDKNALLLVYCRSGRRSQAAAQKLVAMGYAKVKDLGGIISWPYEIEK